MNRGTNVPSDALTVGNLLHDTLVCDFDSVMFCGKQSAEGRGRTSRNLLVCMIIANAGWYAVG